VHRGIGSFICLRGGPLVWAVMACIALTVSLAESATAQRLDPKTGGTGGGPGVIAPGPGGIGAGPGLIAPMPQPSLSPTLPAPAITPEVAPPVAAPAAPASVVRFRCDVAPQDQSCREPGAPDGGGDDSECTCARDRCYTTEAGNRVCEKLQ